MIKTANDLYKYLNKIDDSNKDYYDLEKTYKIFKNSNNICIIVRQEDGCFFFSKYNFNELQNVNYDTICAWLKENCTDYYESSHFDPFSMYVMPFEKQFWSLVEKYNLMEEIANWWKPYFESKMGEATALLELGSMNLPDKYKNLFIDKTKYVDANGFLIENKCMGMCIEGKCKYLKNNMCTVINAPKERNLIIENFLQKVEDSGRLKIDYRDYDDLSSFLYDNYNGKISVYSIDLNNQRGPCLFEIYKEQVGDIYQYRFTHNTECSDDDRLDINEIITSEEQLKGLISEVLDDIF